MREPTEDEKDSKMNARRSRIKRYRLGKLQLRKSQQGTNSPREGNGKHYVLKAGRNRQENDPPARRRRSRLQRFWDDELSDMMRIAALDRDIEEKRREQVILQKQIAIGEELVTSMGCVIRNHVNSGECRLVANASSPEATCDDKHQHNHAPTKEPTEGDTEEHRDNLEEHISPQ